MEDRKNLVALVILILVASSFFSFSIYIWILEPKLTGFPVGSEVTINIPPTFNHSRPIANQSFREDESIENAFNIDFHFNDTNSDSLALKMFGNTSTYAEVNSTTNNVTIKATRDFNGLETVYFLVDDGYRRNASSNNITVNVTPMTDWHWHYNEFNSSNYNFTYPEFFALYDQFAFLNFSSLMLNFSSYYMRGEDINFTQIVNMSFNRMFVNSTLFPELNFSAIITLSGLTLTNPRVVRDSSICPASICTEISYSGGTFIFNVTSFSEYIAEETPSGGGDTGTGGGGGGGGTGRITGGGAEDFTVDAEILKVTLTHGEIKRISMKITNTGKSNIGLNVDLRDIGDLLVYTGIVSSSTVPLTLKAGEDARLELTLQAQDSLAPGTYVKKVRIRGPTKEKEILLIVDVNSKEPLFDVDIEIPGNSKEIEAGDILTSKISIFNLHESGRVDVKVEFEVRHIDGTIISSSEKTVAIETTLSFIENFQIPSDAKKGNYVLGVKITYQGKTSSASELFSIIEKNYLGLSRELVVAILSILGIMIIFTMSFFALIGLINLKKENSRRNREGIHYSHLEVEELMEMISRARELIRNGRVDEASEFYTRIKRRFDSLPTESKKEVYESAYNLASMLRNAIHQKSSLA